jgi:hypothetical protein
MTLTSKNFESPLKLKSPGFVPGDLVYVTNADELSLFYDWGSSERRGPPGNRIGKFLRGQIGIIMETTEHRGGNGCKVMVVDGPSKVGWVNMYFLRKI